MSRVLALWLLAVCSLCCLMASARFSLLPLLLPLHLPLPSPYPPRHECWCAACERRIERRLADLYVDSDCI